MTETDRVRPPLRCRLHLWHRWQRQRVDDAEGYGTFVLMCRDCGLERSVPPMIGGGDVGMGGGM